MVRNPAGNVGLVGVHGRADVDNAMAAVQRRLQALVVIKVPNRRIWTAASSLRMKARTLEPRAANAATTFVPVLPDAPVTRMGWVKATESPFKI